MLLCTSSGLTKQIFLFASSDFDAFPVRKISCLAIKAWFAVLKKFRSSKFVKLEDAENEAYGMRENSERKNDLIFHSIIWIDLFVLWTIYSRSFITPVYTYCGKLLRWTSFITPLLYLKMNKVQELIWSSSHHALCEWEVNVKFSFS